MNNPRIQAYQEVKLDGEFEDYAENVTAPAAAAFADPFDVRPDANPLANSNIF
jgi:hypothetical protein